MSTSSTIDFGPNAIRTFFHISIVILLLFSFTPPLGAQLLPFQYYTVDNGLLSNAPTTLFQDSQGLLYIGTAEGLSVFNGYEFTNYRTKDGLPSNFILAVYEQQSHPGMIWIGTENGLAVLHDNHITTRPLDSTGSSYRVLSIGNDMLGRIWCGSSNGLYIISDDSTRRIDLGLNTVNQMEILGASGDSSIQVALNDQILEVSPGGIIIRRLNIASSPANYLTSIHCDDSRNVWVGLADGKLSQYHDNTLVYERSLPEGYVTHLWNDTSTLYIGSSVGLFSISIDRFAHDRFDFVGSGNGLPGLIVNGGIIDREGSMWISCRDRGIARLTSRALQFFPLADVPASYNNNGAICDSGGHYWVASGNNIVEIYEKDGHWSMRNHDVHESNDQPVGIVYDRYDRLWVRSSGSGIRCFRIKRKNIGSSRLVETEWDSGILEKISSGSFIIDRKDRLWCSVSDLGTILVDSQLSNLLPMHTAAGDTDVRAIYEDKHGNIWIGGYSGGIGIMRADSLRLPPRMLSPGNELPAGFIRAFCEDQEGNMWVGTRYGGCMVMSLDGTGEPTGIRVLSTKDVLPSDAIWAITRDKSGRMWLGTSLGLSVVDPANFRSDPIGNGLVREPVIGLGTSPTGEIWFVTRAGFGVIDPEMVMPLLSLPKAEISEMEVDGQRVDLLPYFELPYDQNSCTFDFLSVSFRGTQDIRYQYRMIGISEDWQQQTSDRSVTYASLQPGTYRFEVRSTRLGLEEYGEIDSTTFTIAAPLWRRPWFVGLAGLSVVAIVMFTFHRRLERLKREKRLQEEFSRRLIESQENERKRIAGELHDSLGQDLLVIRNRALLGLKEDLPDSAHDQLDQISAVASQAINDVRAISYNLRPYQLDRLGLTKAISSIASALDHSCPVRFNMDLEPIDDAISKEHAIHVYRIVQEGINNILKHAGATDATVTLGVVDSTVRLTIKDNGRGFTREPGNVPGGFGLVGISERARVLGGTATVESAAGSGTTLVVVIPVTRQVT